MLRILRWFIKITEIRRFIKQKYLFFFMDSNNQEIEDFLKAVEKSFSGVDNKNVWPLNCAQFCAYFDIVEALDIYHRLNKLKEKLSVKEIAELMPAPDVIRGCLQLNLIIGLKNAKKFGVEDISTEDRVKYVLFLFDILKQKVKNNIFCLDDKNLLLGEKEIEKIAYETDWDVPISTAEKDQISFLIVSANNLCYTLYFDPYPSGGFYIHGPYDTTKRFGKDTILVIRDYYNINPKEIWSDLDMPYKKLRILGVYKGLDLKLNYLNHPISTTSVGDKLIAFKIYLDDKELDIKKVNELGEFFQKIYMKQTEKINELSDLDKVRKGAEISFYLFRKLRESMGDDWRPPKEVEQMIAKEGDRFIKKLRYETNPPLENWKRIFDPRDDYFNLP
jgi:hypothetical protein